MYVLVTEFFNCVLHREVSKYAKHLSVSVKTGSFLGLEQVMRRLHVYMVLA